MKPVAKGGYVATVVAAPGTSFHANHLRELAGHLEAGRTEWLAEGVAADIFFSGMPPEAAYVKLKNHFADMPFDVIAQPIVSREKKLLMADMESTMIEEEMLDELADLIGHRDEVARITKRAMNGEIDFAVALKERAALLKGQPEAILKKAQERITYSPGAQALVVTVKRRHTVTWLVSGGFECFVRPVARKLGFDVSYANDLEVRGGKITGVVAEPILDKDKKLDLLQQACRNLRFDLSETVTIGDGANDVPMLKACNDGGGLGIAYRAKPSVRMQIPHQINNTDLTTLLYALGYKREEIISSSRT